SRSSGRRTRSPARDPAAGGAGALICRVTPSSGPGPRGSGVHASIDAVWRLEAARIIAGLARMVGDIGIAEDLAQDALLAALEQWPESGVPDAGPHRPVRRTRPHPRAEPRPLGPAPHPPRLHRPAPREGHRRTARPLRAAGRD